MLLLYGAASAATSPALQELLSEHALQDLGAPLEALGVGTPAELSHLDEEDLHSLGASLKKYEQRRWQALLAVLSAAEQEKKRFSSGRQLSRMPPGDASEAFNVTLENTLPDVLGPLKTALLEGYDATAPPGGLVEPAVQVKLGLNLCTPLPQPQTPRARPCTISLVPDVCSCVLATDKFNGVDLSRGTMEVHKWLRMSWHDPRLAWDPAQWGGIDMVTMPVRHRGSNR